MTIFFDTNRCIVKLPTLTDLDDWSSLCNESKELTQALLRSSIINYKKYGFSIGSIFLKESNHFIGRAGLYYYEDNNKYEVEMGCILHHTYQNKGYGAEISTQLINWGFQKSNINKLTALTRLDNNKSQAVLKKIGMKYVKNIEVGGEIFLLHEISR